MPESPDSPEKATPLPTAPPSVPAGWYPTPDGKQKYWDGIAWTNLPWDEPISQVSPKPTRRKISRRARTIAIAAIAALILAGGVGIAVKLTNDASVAAAHAAKLASAKKNAAEAAAAKQAAERAAAAAQKVEDDAERSLRASTVKGIEASVKKMAKQDAKIGAIDGPILRATCSPVGGGSTDDLTQLTTVFECFVANKNNSDGTQSGYYFNATMNWTTGSYTYGLGKPS
ncbi:MAG: hypothetical protein JWR36_1592 [Glaciihabitans sp.]|nr:hypothetical protein [Glaciihabitans sp.]